MAAKRLRNGSDEDPEKPENKRLRSLPSFATVIREAVMVKSFQNFFGALEPLLRRVVQEEVERGLVQSTRLFQRSPQLHIEAPEPSSLKLIFKSPLSLPIFTGSRIEDMENNPIQIQLVDTRNAQNSLATLPFPIRVEIVVLDGDFPSEHCEKWSSNDFNRSIVRERTGRRPLLTGDVLLMLRDGVASIGELTFTDNSSWIRSQHFCIGARVVPGSHEGPRIGEAVTEPFRVKDHRGELYRKHYPPSLNDEVWRLERIGKDGAFHTRLATERINTVQDFLMLWMVDPTRLRRILGVGMSDRMWEGTIGHARTCVVGEKLYVHQKQHCAIVLNSICEVVRVVLGCTSYSPHELSRSQKAFVQTMVLEAYHNWDKLEESADGLLWDTAPLQDEPIIQGAIEASSSHFGHPENSLSEIRFGGYGYEEAETSASNLHMEFSTTMIQWAHVNDILG